MTKVRTASPSATPNEAAAPRSTDTTKSATVLALLRREQGSTLAELVEATAWQPHTARAMLTGLRKKGHAIERFKRGDLTCYHLPSAAA